MARIADPLLLSPARSSNQTAIDALYAFVCEDLKHVSQTIFHKMVSQVPLIPTLAKHLISAGGKRLRPMLTLASAKLAGYQGQRHIPLAACVEFIHTATLLHDDVVDESQLRRGIPSANAVWGNKASVLVGDFLFSRAFELMVADGSLEVLRILSKASSMIIEGEVLQLMTSNDTTTTEINYLEVIKAKTAQLFAAACHIGGVMAECNDQKKQALENFGENFGIAFQLIDDILDYSADQATLGKTVGNDFQEGKITLPVLLAYTQGNAVEKAFWHRTLHELDQQPEDFALAATYLENHKIFSQVIERAATYSLKAQEALRTFPDSLPRQLLLDVTDFCVHRAF